MTGPLASRRGEAPGPDRDRSAPTAPQSRFEIIDVLRGFALLGVILANWRYTGSRLFLSYSERQDLPTAGIDRLFQMAGELLVDDKFYTMFSILFGLGFALQLGRASARAQSLIPVYSRRLAILFAIGLAHAICLYYGDILHRYALLGFIMILFRNCRDRVLWGTAMGIFCLTAFFPTFEQWALELWPAPESGIEMSRPERLAAARSGAMGVIRLNWNLLRMEYESFLGWSLYYFEILGRFLLGFYIGRKGILQHADRYLPLYRRLLPWGLGIGLLGSGVHVYALFWHQTWLREEGFPLSLLWILVEAGFLALSFAYISGFVLSYNTRRGRRLLAPLAAVGRMALTNYLMQSVLFVLIFYAGGLVGHVGGAVSSALAVLVFILQILASNWWLRRFRFGPAEWVWRCLTYGKRVAMR